MEKVDRTCAATPSRPQTHHTWPESWSAVRSGSAGLLKADPRWWGRWSRTAGGAPGGTHLGSYADWKGAFACYSVVDIVCCVLTAVTTFTKRRRAHHPGSRLWIKTTHGRYLPRHRCFNWSFSLCKYNLSLYESECLDTEWVDFRTSEFVSSRTEPQNVRSFAFEVIQLFFCVFSLKKIIPDVTQWND